MKIWRWAAVVAISFCSCATAGNAEFESADAQGTDAWVSPFHDASLATELDAAPTCGDPCERMSQCGCPGGACDLDLNNQSTGGAICREIQVPGGRNSTCSSMQECDAGFICLSGQCREYCDASHPCVDGACLVQPVYSAGNGTTQAIPGLMACSKDCVPERATGNGCPGDPQFGCHLIQHDPTPGNDGDEYYYTDCKSAPATGGGEGADCSERGDLDCRAGYECVSISNTRVCKQLCLPPAGACLTGSCSSFVTPIHIDGVEYGVCL